MIGRDQSQIDSDDELEDMMSEFQGIDAPSVSLVEAVRRGRRKLVRGRIILVVLTLLVACVATVSLVTHFNAPMFVFAVSQMGLILWVGSFILRSSRHAWEARSHTTRGFLELELERRRDWIRRMRFVRKRAIPFLFVSMTLHHAFLIHANPSMLSGGRLLSELFGFGFPCLVLVGVLWNSTRRQDRFEREAEQLAGQILELSVDDSKLEL